MVVGSVCSEFGGCGDSRNELAIAKKNSLQAIPSIAPVQIGPWCHPETAYANPDGASFLKSVRMMEMNIEKLIPRMEALEQKSINQERELTLLRPLKATAIGIRDRFFATFLKSMSSANIGNLSVIAEGNKNAHEGDVITDICLLQNGMISYPATFRRLYGLHWEEANSLLTFPHMVKVMNCRATRIANGGAEEDLQDEFNELLLWTRHATADDIAIFNADPTGSTHHKLIYLRLTKKIRRRR
ncbi:hypothetical protein HOY80DRAFT_296330 [Tuber brumale]|nr:hypothetical protein HOY80DRAFT_296330 [Tuber brumale]